jgi:hypothetical protein
MICLDRPEGINVVGAEQKIEDMIMGITQYGDLVKCLIYHMLQIDEAPRWTFAALSEALKLCNI